MIAVAESSFDTTVTQQRATKTNDGFGHQTEVWNTVNAALKVVIQTPSEPMYAAIAQRIGVDVVWRVLFSLSADVRGGDRLVIGTDTLFVHTIETPQSYSVLNSAICAEVR